MALTDLRDWFPHLSTLEGVDLRCSDTGKCTHYTKYQALNCSHCMVCSKPIHAPQQKEASNEKQTFFKHGSEDI